MTIEELDMMVSRKEKLLKIGARDFQKRHDIIIKEIKRIKSICESTGKYNKSSE